ncbi:MAG: large conductance mechanosensitive channel protein MscL [Minisyncoccia bacterium]
MSKVKKSNIPERHSVIHMPDLVPDIDPMKIKETGFNFIKEFQSFALQGNVIDLAVGIIIGAAFNSLVQSLVKDLVMPIFGWIIGGTDFSSLYISLNGSFDSLAAAQAAKAPIIMYGLFINQIINFLIVSFSIFIVLKVFLRRKAEELLSKKK